MISPLMIQLDSPSISFTADTTVIQSLHFWEVRREDLTETFPVTISYTPNHFCATLWLTRMVILRTGEVY